MGGHKACSHVLATVKNAALSVCTDASAWNYAFISLEYGPGSESCELYLIHFILRNLLLTSLCMVCSYYCGQVGTIYFCFQL